MPVITGTGQNDNLNGTDEADLIRGLNGSDSLYGAGGDDQIEGGEGNDSLRGGRGDDLLLGGAGNDTLGEDEGSSDEMYGEDGDDWLYHYGSDVAGIDALLDGGTGDDKLFHFQFRTGTSDLATLIGGAGYDWIQSFGGGHVTIDAGADADFVEIINFQTDYDIALGTGSDLLLMHSNQFHRDHASIVVGDFAAGAGGDSLSLISYLTRQTDGWDFAANPFASGHLRLVQSGADTIVQIDRDGASAAAYAFEDLIVLENVTAAALTARNLGGYAADGSATAGETIDGLATPDFVSGTSGDDVIRGFGGHDALFGGAGADRLEGGDGEDRLDGELGDDLLYGGAGNDMLEDTLPGDDQLFGEGGHDRLFIDRQFFLGPSSTALLDGGEGDDQLLFYARVQADDATLIGGTGNDLITAYLGRSVTIDAGTGDDRVSIDIGIGNAVITLGAGTDTLALSSYLAPLGGFTVLDFNPAAGADRLELSSGLSNFLSGWNSAINPFAANYMRLAQSGADALLLADASGNGDAFKLMGRLLGVDAAQFNAINLGYAPGPIAIGGTLDADSLVGTAGGDEIIALDGDDLVDGGGGADRMLGGGGSDVYFIDSAGDVVVELLGDGRDIAYASVNYALTAGAYVEVLSAAALGGTDPLQLSGNERSNEIYGNAGANVLRGGGGSDLLLGGLGDDIYYITSGGETIFEYAGQGRDIIYTGLSHGLAAGSHVEVLSAISLSGTDALQLSGNERDQEIYGNAGANVLRGGGGTDFLLGGFGDDTYYVTDGREIIFEAAGEGRDIVYTGLSHALAGGSHVEILSAISLSGTDALNFGGNELDNYIFGNAGSNILYGGGGLDNLIGGGGDDTYYILGGNEILAETAGGGRDIAYTDVSYTLTQGANVELLSAASLGGTQAIDLTGNAIANGIYGNAGANTIDGKSGADYLSGGGGADSFAFTTHLGGGNVDTLADFASGLDRILLDDAIFAGIAPGALAAGAFVTGAAATDIDDRIVYDSVTGQLFYDLDGSGAGSAVQFASVAAGTVLAASDFAVI